MSHLSDDPELPEFLHRVARALRDAVARAERWEDPDREPIVGLVRTALEAVENAGRELARRVEPPPPDALAAWSHRLREPVTVVAAWVEMLAPGLDAASRARGREAIERNVRLLVERLGEPPPSGRAVS